MYLPFSHRIRIPDLLLQKSDSLRDGRLLVLLIFLTSLVLISLQEGRAKMATCFKRFQLLDRPKCRGTGQVRILQKL